MARPTATRWRWPPESCFGPALEQLLDVEGSRGFLDALVDLVFRQLANPEPEGHVLVNGHVRVQGVILEDHRDVAIFGRNVVDELGVDIKLAFGDVLETRDHSKRSRLAAARGADEDHELLVIDDNVRIVDGAYIAIVDLPDFLELYLCHGILPLGVMLVITSISGTGASVKPNYESTRT